MIRPTHTFESVLASIVAGLEDGSITVTIGGEETSHKQVGSINPSYCRIRLEKDAAISRLANWMRIPQIGLLVPTSSGKAVGLACDEHGHWRGGALFIHENDGWTVFYDLSGVFGFCPGANWLELARNDELVFAAYNDAICYGELVVCGAGKVIREFLDLRDSPEDNLDNGRLDSDIEPIESWVEVASFVDEDDLWFAEQGWLWVLGSKP